MAMLPALFLTLLGHLHGAASAVGWRTLQANLPIPAVSYGPAPAPAPTSGAASAVGWRTLQANYLPIPAVAYGPAPAPAPSAGAASAVGWRTLQANSPLPSVSSAPAHPAGGGSAGSVNSYPSSVTAATPARTSGAFTPAAKLVLVEAVKNWSVACQTLSALSCVPTRVEYGDIETWDTSRIQNMSELFKDCSSFNEPIGRWNTARVTTMNMMFQNASEFNQPLGTWNTASVTDMSFMFRYSRNFNQPVANWSTSKVVNMNGMFYAASEFNQPINYWKTDTVKDMAEMFRSAMKFNEPIGSWNTARVADMRCMFRTAPTFNQVINDWNTGMVTSMKEMFHNARRFSSRISDWNTARVVNMQGMFSSALRFNTPISQWNTASVEVMSSMFAWAVEFNQPMNDWNTVRVIHINRMFLSAHKFNMPIGQWNLARVRNFAYMFHTAHKFNMLLERWNTAGAHHMQYMFYAADKFNMPIEHWNIAAVKNMDHMFRAAHKFNMPISQWNTARVQSMRGVFCHAHEFNQPIIHWNTARVTRMNRMFMAAFNFNQPIHQWNTGRVGDMAEMFRSATSFNSQLGLGTGFSTTRVTNMSRMFYNATIFNQPIGTWNTRCVTDLRRMFQHASTFHQDVGTWDTARVTRMSGLFRGATAFNHPIGHWNTSHVKTMATMFLNASSFNQDLGNWNVGSVIDMSDMFLGARDFCQQISSWRQSAKSTAYQQASDSWHDRSAACLSSSTTKMTTTTPSGNFTTQAAVVGEMHMNVANVTDQFCKSSVVIEAFRRVIAELANVSVPWVQKVQTWCKLRRLLHFQAERLLLTVKGNANVAVSYEIHVPRNAPQQITATLIYKKLEAQSLRHATDVVNRIIGQIFPSMNISVSWQYVEQANLANVPHSGQASKSSGTDVVMVIVLVLVITILLCLLAVAGIVILIQNNKTENGWNVIESIKAVKNATTMRFRGGDSANILKSLDHILKTCNIEALLKPPPAISYQQGQKLYKDAQTMLNYKEHSAPVFLTYAIGKREKDADACGPGMFYAAAVSKKLFDKGITCYSPLMLPIATPREFFSAQMGGKDSSCKVLLVLQTPGLYKCLSCLRDIYTAQCNGIKMFPLRLEPDLPGESDAWPQIEKHNINHMLMLSAVLGGYFKLNSIPSPPYTVPDQPQTLDDVVIDLNRHLGKQQGSQDGCQVSQQICPKVLGKGSDHAPREPQGGNGTRASLLQIDDGLNSSCDHEGSGNTSTEKPLLNGSPDCTPPSRSSKRKGRSPNPHKNDPGENDDTKHQPTNTSTNPMRNSGMNISIASASTCSVKASGKSLCEGEKRQGSKIPSKRCNPARAPKKWSPSHSARRTEAPVRHRVPVAAQTEPHIRGDSVIASGKRQPGKNQKHARSPGIEPFSQQHSVRAAATMSVQEIDHHQKSTPVPRSPRHQLQADAPSWRSEGMPGSGTHSRQRSPLPQQSGPPSRSATAKLKAARKRGRAAPKASTRERRSCSFEAPPRKDS